jgi:copper(I)-binding protein
MTGKGRLFAGLAVLLAGILALAVRGPLSPMAVTNTSAVNSAPALTSSPELASPPAPVQFLGGAVLLPNSPVFPISPDAQTSVAVLSLLNTSERTLRLVSASSPFAGRVRLIQTAHTPGHARTAGMPASMEGMSKAFLQTASALEIPASSRLEMTTESEYIALEQLHQPPKKGEQVILTLTFEGFAPMLVKVKLKHS